MQPPNLTVAADDPGKVTPLASIGLGQRRILRLAVVATNRMRWPGPRQTGLAAERTDVNWTFLVVTRRLVAAVIAVLTVAQSSMWLALGRPRLPAHAVRSYFEFMEARALSQGWDDSGALPRHELHIPQDVVNHLGEGRYRRVVKTLEDFRQDPAVVADWDGDRFSVAVLVDTPVYAAVEVGNIGVGCAQIGTAHYVHVMGRWVEI